MQAAIVKGPTSTLHGARCGLCPGQVQVGQAVLWKRMPNSSYAEDRLVYHVDCMAALVDRAPQGKARPGNHKARAAAIRRSVREGGLFAVPA